MPNGVPVPVFSKKNNHRRRSRVVFKEGRSYETDHLNPSRLCRCSTGLENSHWYRSMFSVKIRKYLEKKIGIGEHLALASILHDVYTTTIEIVRLHAAGQPPQTPSDGHSTCTLPPLRAIRMRKGRRERLERLQDIGHISCG